MKNEYKLKDSASIYILAILVPIIISFALSFILGFISGLVGVETQALLSNMWVYALVLLVSQGSFLAVVLIYNKKKKINTINATTLNKKVGILNYLLVGGISIASLFLFLPLVNWFDALIRSWGYSNSGELPFAINSIPSLIVGLLSMALLPAVCEEIVFRGAIYNGVKNSTNYKTAIILSSLCFCLMHMSLQQTIYPLLLGIVLALIMYFTGSVRATIFAHFCNNAIVIISNYIASFSADTTETVAYTVNFQTTISAFVFLIIGCGVVAFGCWLLKLVNKKKEPEESESISEQISVNENNEIVIENAENTQEKALLETDKKMFWLYIGISVFMWIIENIIYFLG